MSLKCLAQILKRDKATINGPCSFVLCHEKSFFNQIISGMTKLRSFLCEISGSFCPLKPIIYTIDIVRVEWFHRPKAVWYQLVMVPTLLF